MTFYIVNENTPGYLPDSEPYVTESAESAAEYLLSLVDSWCDSLADPDAHTLSDSLGNADDIVALCAADLRDEFRTRPSDGFTFSAEDPDAIAPLQRVWTIVASDTDPTGNPFADGRSVVPDSMGYTLVAVMADGGCLCEDCATDADNPVTDATDQTGPADDPQWAVVGWTHTGDTDAGYTCDHCGRVLSVAWHPCDTDADGHCTGGCVTRPHVWSASGARCTRTGCNVAGTGDPCNDGNCLGTD